MTRGSRRRRCWRVNRKRNVWSYSGQRWWIEISEALTGVTHRCMVRICAVGIGALYRDEASSFERLVEARDWCAERVAEWMGATA